MNENFQKLDEAKKQAIIRAAMKVFANNPYAHANTEEIAFQAGISKGLLFYYFKNKKSLYLYLCDYCEEITNQYLEKINLEETTDFFEIMNQGAKAKAELMRDHPYTLEFILKVWYEKDAPKSDLVQKYQARNSEIIQKYFRNIAYEKFKEGVDFVQIFKMLTWMSEGYLYEKQSLHLPIDLDEMLEEFYRWEALFKQFIYKEEYQ